MRSPVVLSRPVVLRQRRAPEVLDDADHVIGRDLVHVAVAEERDPHRQRARAAVAVAADVARHVAVGHVAQQVTPRGNVVVIVGDRVEGEGAARPWVARPRAGGRCGGRLRCLGGHQLEGLGGPSEGHFLHGFEAPISCNWPSHLLMALMCLKPAPTKGLVPVKGVEPSTFALRMRES